MLEIIDRFERHRLAERSSLMDLRLTMSTVARPSERRKASWSVVGTRAVGAGLKPWNGPLWKCFDEK